MALFEFKLPDIGEGVTEGEVVQWHVQEGERVIEDQLMVEVMTDKATVTIGAPKGGKIDSLRADVGVVVQVGDVLVVINTGNGSRAHGGKASNMPAATAVGDIQETLPGTSYFAERRATASQSAAAAALPEPVVESHYDAKPLATPATRKLARDLKVDLKRVPPTGDGGRVTREDVLGASGQPIPATSAQATAPAAPTVVPAPPPPATPESDSRPALVEIPPGAETRLPFVGVRRLIAEKMQQSKNTAAHFAFVEECDVDRLIDLRKALQPDAEARGVELTYMPFMIKAVVMALKKSPMLNATLDVERNEIVLRDYFHIGIAAATDQGLVVPVVHHAERLNLIELAAEVHRLGEAARQGTLSVAELSGSTFTITSLGKLGGQFAIPIINFPNVGILGIHRIKERPVVRDGKVTIGNVMMLSLSLDHRIVDGHVGAAFAYDVISYLEEPGRMLLEL